MNLRRWKLLPHVDVLQKLTNNVLQIQNIVKATVSLHNKQPTLVSESSKLNKTSASFLGYPKLWVNLYHYLSKMCYHLLIHHINPLF